MNQCSNQNNIAIISNPLSGYNSRNGLDKIEMLASQNGLYHIKASTPDEIVKALTTLSKEKLDLLVINGGDGTIDIIVNAIRNQKIFKDEPVLALLKGGTTNLIHRDIGLNGKPEKILRNIIKRYTSTKNITTRRPLEVRYKNKNENPLHGFFIGTGAIPRSILEARKNLHKKGLHGPFSEFLVLLSSLYRLFFKRNLNQDKILKPTELTVNNQERKHIFLIVSTLKKLIPFIQSRATENLAGTIYMGDNRKLKRTQHDHINLKIEESWALDGEMQPPGNIQIALGTPVRFLAKS